MRVLILSHGHPELNAGGGEKAAYSLFQHLKVNPAVSKIIFVARAEPAAVGHDASFGSFRGRPDEILVTPPPVNGFTFQTSGYDDLKRLVYSLVDAFRPDVVHIHHFIFWGAEIFELFKNLGIRVVFTFHEFAAICAHFGQMVKTDGRLCYAASPAECSQCVSVSAGKVFVRNTMLKDLLAAVDCFTAPSRFLLERYVAWGLPRERIVPVENVLDQARIELSGDAKIAPSETSITRTKQDKAVFGFFAQINPFKGLDVLLEAASLLSDDVRRHVTIRVHGENRHYRETEFHRHIETLVEDLRDVVSPMGEYRNDNVLALMSACDWIVVPSVWWENSPVVMQEARLAGRPIICSDIGGMAEKIDRQVDLTFPARSPSALADVISRIVRTETEPEWERLQVLSHVCARANLTHIEQYVTILKGADNDLSPKGAVSLVLRL